MDGTTRPSKNVVPMRLGNRLSAMLIVLSSRDWPVIRVVQHKSYHPHELQWTERTLSMFPGSLLSSSMGTELRMFRSSVESSWSPEVESDDFRGVRKFKNSPLVATHPSRALIKWLLAELSRTCGVVTHSSPWRTINTSNGEL